MNDIFDWNIILAYHSQKVIADMKTIFLNPLNAKVAIA